MYPLRTIVLAAALACMGCQNSVNVPTLPDAVLQLSANPASITATECPPSSCGAGSDDVEAITTMVLRETAGGSATLQGFAVTVRRNSDDATILSTTVGIGAGTRVTFMQTVSVPFAVHFPRSEAGSAMTLTATANLRDDKGQAPVFATVTIPVAAVGSTPSTEARPRQVAARDDGGRGRAVHGSLAPVPTAATPRPPPVVVGALSCLLDSCTTVGI